MALQIFTKYLVCRRSHRKVKVSMCSCSANAMFPKQCIELTPVPLITVQKAFHLLSLETHPDRVDEDEREAATQKFQVLSKLYGVLMNEKKRNYSTIKV